MSEEALRIAEKRREAKGKGKRERDIQVNAEFQRITRRDEKAFLNEQCKEIENNRMGKTRDLKKIGEIPRKMFMQSSAQLKERNSKDLIEAEEIKKKLQEYTEELYKKGLNDPDKHDAVVTHLEPDMVDCEVKWALGSITMNKASGGDGIPAELFQIFKDDAVKVLHSIC